MDAEATQLLYTLLGWLVLGICMLVGLSKAGPVGAFRALWALVAMFFALRLADVFAVPAGKFVADLLSCAPLTGEVLGFWAVFALVHIGSMVWIRLVTEDVVAFPPIVDQIVAPLLGVVSGFLLGLAVYQSLWITEWGRTRLGEPAKIARSTLAKLDQTWFPSERVASTPAEPSAVVPAPGAGPAPQPVAPAGNANPQPRSPWQP